MIKQKTTEYCVPLNNEIGSLYRLTLTLAKAGVNITGISVQSMGDILHARFLADRESGAVRRPLEAAGYQVFDRTVFQLELQNQPGELSRVCKALADEEIQNLSGTAEGLETAKLVVAVDKPEKASPLFSRASERTAVAA